MNDAYFFLGLFAFVFVVWFATGGPTRPLSFAGPVLTTNISSKGVSYSGGTGFFPTAPGVSYTVPQGTRGTTGQNLNQISQQVTQVGNQVDTLSQKVAQTVAFGTPSPYRGTVFMNHYVSDAGAADPAKEYVTIRVAANAPGPVDISGWRLQSDATGAGATIPFGTEVPRSGLINAVQPIELSPGDMAIISSGRSPIGASFRENKCIGYFAQYQSFYPPLPLICPTPYDELKQFYGPNYIRDDACITYAQSLNRCTLVATPPVNMTSACTTFLTNYLNYNGCVDAHQQDTNFMGNTWRVYLGRNVSMWRSQHEVVRLLDANGKTVDLFPY
ncbi:MAG: hypothetical protein B7X04_02800 [Parcubacteria group bacterium 21-54-25]|nr:MAG: hypothetical protein B7X04_02800 [Parcubacteria group bacterium 21-54-25]HQU07718.1 hypothetical protein [Candidatus Paceibacterota bacterium]